MVDEKRNTLEFGTWSIVAGTFVVVLALLWVIMELFIKDDSSNEVTWVG